MRLDVSASQALLKAYLQRLGTDWQRTGGELRLGTSPVAGRDDIVDLAAAATGGVATIFSGDERVATSLRKPDGSRAVGTHLADPVVRATVLERGQTFDGVATILGRSYLTLYEPPKLVLEPVLAGMRALRWVKHADEIALMREIAGLTDWVQDRYREAIRPGRLVMEMDMSMAVRLVEEAAIRFPEQHVEVMRCWTLSGPPSAAPHGDGKSSSALIAEGHGLVNIVVVRVNGLVVENERTWFCGKPNPQQVKLFEAASGANQAACEAAVTGAPVSAIDAAAQAVIERAGFAEHILHRTGHGMGTLGHEFPEDMAFNHRPLLEREVYSAEPGLYVFGLGGFRHDDTVVVGEVPEVLTHAPKDLRSQTIL